MTAAGPDLSDTIDAWHTYWQGTEDAAAFASGGVSDPVTRQFWLDFFGTVTDDVQVVDFASGSGAVLKAASEIFTDRLPSFCCIDTSPAAVEMLQARYPGVQGVVADARDTSLDSAGFDIATSQFGVEYAGLDAVDEMLRLLRERGQLALLLHHRDGGIFRECSDGLTALEMLREANFVALSMDMFDKGYALLRGGPKEPYNAATREVLKALGDLEKIIGRFGKRVAGNTIRHLFNTVVGIQERIQFHDPDKVRAWLEGVDSELDAYAGRLASQRQAALSPEDFLGLCNKVEATGFTLQKNEALYVPGSELPIAWSLVASRS